MRPEAQATLPTTPLIGDSVLYHSLGRVERWRGNPQEISWLYPAFPPSSPFRNSLGSVSNARHIARSERISRTTRSCTLHVQGYETYGIGTAVGDGRYETRYWLKRPSVS
jgi:hypothetical protein